MDAYEKYVIIAHVNIKQRTNSSIERMLMSIEY